MRIITGVFILVIVFAANAVQLPDWLLMMTAASAIALFVSTIKGNKNDVRNI
jgi:hypothetical protein